MRLLLSSLIVMIGLSVAQADIQDPPAKKFGPTRKLSRGVANILHSTTEIPSQMCIINDSEGNSAAFSYGIISGVRRTCERIGVGIYEVATHPFPTHRGGYKPLFKSPVRGHNGTYTEFPPELGFETQYTYVRH